MEETVYKKYYQKNHLGKLSSNIIQNLVNSDSVTVYGMIGSGREFFLRHVRAYLPSSSRKKWLFVTLNADLLETLEVELISDLIVRQIIEQVPSLQTYPFSESDNLGYSINNLYLLLKECQKLSYSILFMINNFEYWVSNKSVVQFLKGIKELRFLRFSILLSIDMLILKQNNWFTCASLAPNLYRLEPLNEKDAMTMMRANSKVFKWKLNEKIVNSCLYYSAGNAGLIKYLHRVLSEKPNITSEKELFRTDSIKYKMEAHTKELKDLLGLKNITLSDLKDIKNRDLLNRSGYVTRGKLFSPLFAMYFKGLKKVSAGVTRGDLSNRLSKQEFDIFSSMNKSIGEIFSLDKLAEILWGDKIKQKFSLWAIYRIMSSLRQKLVGSDYELDTIRRRGYRLILKS